MPVTLKQAPRMLQPAGSHWLKLETGQRRPRPDGTLEPFASEELYPILEVDAPRIGVVRAQFSADRYVSSSYNDETGASTALWSDWRIYLKDVRLPDEERPDLPHLGRSTSAGEATRAAIREACEPVIREWLESDGYLESRRRTVAQAIRRELDYPRSYVLSRAEERLQRLQDELGPDEFAHLAAMLRLLAQAAEGLEREAGTS